MKKHPLQAQAGFSLIELMVGIAVSLVLIAIASSIFVGGVRSSRTQEERSKQTETAQLVMEILTRDIRNAGFFPAMNPGKPDDNPKIKATVGFVKKGFPGNVVNTAFPAFDNPIFACADAKYDRATGLCESAGSLPNSDTLIINYFSEDSFPQTASTFPGLGAGTRMNCLNESVDSLPHNTTSTINFSPVLVSNIYYLVDSPTYQGNQNSITTRSFGCWPLGAAGTAFQPFFQGVEQLRYRFGLIDATTFQSPRRFYTITEMNALPAIPIGGTNRTAWSRVVSVEICIQTRSLENNSRESSAIPVVDCDGATIPAPTTGQARPIIAINREVINLRNAAGATL
jgi:type IV pilus assembly protein PilW